MNPRPSRDALMCDGLEVAERRRPRHPRGVPRSEAQMDLAFVAPVLETPTREIRGMVRGNGSIETQAAAVKVRRGGRCAQIRRRILDILVVEGPQNCHMLEDRTEFRHDGVCTVRKRITELTQEGMVVKVGREDGCALWGIAHSRDAAVCE